MPAQASGSTDGGRTVSSVCSTNPRHPTTAPARPPAAVVAQIETRLHEGLEYRTPVEAEAAFTEAEVTAPAVP